MKFWIIIQNNIYISTQRVLHKKQGCLVKICWSAVQSSKAIGIPSICICLFKVYPIQRDISWQTTCKSVFVLCNLSQSQDPQTTYLIFDLPNLLQASVDQWFYVWIANFRFIYLSPYLNILEHKPCPGFSVTSTSTMSTLCLHCKFIPID